MDVTTKLELDTIKILKPVNVNNNIYFGIQDGPSPLILQTDFAYLKYKPIVFESGYCKIDLDIFGEFELLIEKLEKHVCGRLQKRYSKYMDNFGYSKKMLRTRTMKVESVEVFDWNKTLTSIGKLTNGDKVRFLIHVDKYIYNPYKSYLNYKLLQIQVFTVVGKMPDIPVYEKIIPDKEKYDKMLSIGIPICAVHHKMKMDGIDDKLINAFGRKISGTIPPPPPPPPRPPPPIIGGVSPMFAILGDIKGGNFNLKKAPSKGDTALHNTSAREKILRCIDTSRKVPSLKEIQNALNNLRKIK